MALLKIARLGHPVLRTPARRVEPAEIRTDGFQALVDDMIDTMRDADGVGLAANQVHVGLRVFVLEARENPRYPEAPDVPLGVVVNPVLERSAEDDEPGWEGCLSIPGLRGIVPRARRVRVEGLDREGRPLAFEAQGFHARIVQHECDHLDGRVYLDRMPDLRSLSFLEELGRFHLEK